MSDFIPVNEPVLDGNEKKYLNQCIDTGWISSEGPFIREFEEKFAARVGPQARHRGLQRLRRARCRVAALDLGPGDEVIMPTFTIISCASAVSRLGAMPVLVDCDPAPGTWTSRAIEDRITARTRAIMAVHIYGLPVDMDPILADRGATRARRDRGCGRDDRPDLHGPPMRHASATISTFSFYPNKHVTTGEGGMIVTDDDALAERCRSLRNLTMKAARRFVHEELGWNFRMTNLQAAVGLAQLERLDEFVPRKRAHGRPLHRSCCPASGLQLPVASDRLRHEHLLGLRRRDP